jgi:CRP/FNR family transcriptional regulator, cyclic AMP receptor protein
MTSEEEIFRSDFLSGLTDRAREKFLSMGETFHFRAGEVIFRQDDVARYLYLIKKGNVAIEMHIPTRGTRRIDTVGQGEIFSWSAVVFPHIETATARALDDTEVLGVRGDALVLSCKKDCPFCTDIYRALVGTISSRLRATRLQVLDIYANP